MWAATNLPFGDGVVAPILKVMTWGWFIIGCTALLWMKVKGTPDRKAEVCWAQFAFA